MRREPCPCQYFTTICDFPCHCCSVNLSSCHLSPLHLSYVTVSRSCDLSEFYPKRPQLPPQVIDVIWLLYLFGNLLIPTICSVIRNILPIKITYRYKLVLHHQKVSNIKFYLALILLFYYCFVICTFHLLKRFLTGMKNLDEVKYLEMKVDTRDNSLGNFGKNYKFLWFMQQELCAQVVQNNLVPS